MVDTDGPSLRRPGLTHHETDLSMLDYYHSKDAGRGGPSSSSSSLASEVNQGRRLSTATVRGEANDPQRRAKHRLSPVTPLSGAFQSSGESSTTSVKRRPSKRAAENADNRRLAIMELANSSSDLSQYTSGSSSDNLPASSDTPSRLLSRRGIDRTHMAIIAPPDAAPSSYQDLTPPIGGRRSGHNRSQSTVDEISIKETMPSRDIGIVGAALSAPATAHPQLIQQQQQQHRGVNQDPQYSLPTPVEPVFQTPTTSPSRRAPQPTNLAPQWDNQPDILTPAIGQSKELEARVAGPTVLPLSEADMNWSRSFTPGETNSSGGSQSEDELRSLSAPLHMIQYPNDTNEHSYMFYDPAIHGTAGPPPSPPKALQAASRPTSISPPPRPPRLSSPPSSSSSRKGQVYPSIHDVQLGSPESASSAPTTVQTTPTRQSRHTREQASHERTYDSSYGSISSVNGLGRALSQTSVASSSAFSGVTSDGSLYSDESYTTPPRASSERHAKHSPTTYDDVSSIQSHSTSHFREGATSSIGAPSPPSKDTPYMHAVQLSQDSGTMEDLMTAVGDAIDSIGLIDVRDVPPPTVIQPSWETKLSARQSKPDMSGAYSSDGHREHHAPLRSRSNSPVKNNKLPTPPSTAGSDHRSSSSSFSSASKRLSVIRRTASSLSLPRFSTSSPTGHHHHHPEPIVIVSQSNPLALSTPAAERTRRLRTKIVGWPQAMNFQDVLRMRTSLDRAAGYAEKINELAAGDCGLAIWAADVKRKKRGPGLSRSSTQEKDTLSPLAAIPGVNPRAHLQRQMSHMSRNSVASEETFAIRPDAYTATNLRARSSDDSPADSLPLTLPYPSLAVSSRNLTPSTSVRSFASSNSSRHGFFASIGRKTSMKRERNMPLQAGYRPPATRLPISAPPRPISLDNVPQIPGGPRAPPRRQSSISSPNTPSSSSSTTSFGAPRPSAESHSRPPALTSRSSLVAHAPRDPHAAFNMNLNKLRDVLPHVESTILSAYLRKYGNDMAAISAYLEDERNGRVMRG